MPQQEVPWLSYQLAQMWAEGEKEVGLKSSQESHIERGVRLFTTATLSVMPGKSCLELSALRLWSTQCPDPAAAAFVGSRLLGGGDTAPPQRVAIFCGDDRTE